jgi:hypothetical protein
MATMEVLGHDYLVVRGVWLLQARTRNALVNFQSRSCITTRDSREHLVTAAPAVPSSCTTRGTKWSPRSGVRVVHETALRADRDGIPLPITPPGKAFTSTSANRVTAGHSSVT